MIKYAFTALLFFKFANSQNVKVLQEHGFENLQEFYKEDQYTLFYEDNLYRFPADGLYQVLELINISTKASNGYVFISFNETIDYDLVNLNPYSTSIITKNGQPILIPEEQMRLMIDHIESRYSHKDLKSRNVGDFIEINTGSLNGLTGQIIEIRNNKIYLQIESLSAQVEIQYAN